MCTTAAPFSLNYVQKEGVSMGSQHGPTFADFYMSHVENNLLCQDSVPNPVFYARYVDDTLNILSGPSHFWENFFYQWAISMKHHIHMSNKFKEHFIQTIY